RGSTEALQILANGSGSNAAPRKIVINVEAPAPEKVAPEAPQAAPDAESGETVSEAEKSRRWIAGFKQRLDEQNLRRLNRNEPPPQPKPIFAEPEPEPEPELK